MLLGVGKTGFNWWYSLQTTPSTTPGVSVTPGSGSKGSYVQLASGANLVNDVYGLLLWIVAGNTTATIRDILLDIGIDPAGGTSYAQLGGINNIFVPQAGNAVQGGRMFYFPLFIKAGQSVGAQRIRQIILRPSASPHGSMADQFIRSSPQSEPTPRRSASAATAERRSPAAIPAAWGSWTSLGRDDAAMLVVATRLGP